MGHKKISKTGKNNLGTLRRPYDNIFLKKKIFLILSYGRFIKYSYIDEKSKKNNFYNSLNGANRTRRSAKGGFALASSLNCRVQRVPLSSALRALEALIVDLGRVLLFMTEVLGLTHVPDLHFLGF